MAIFNNDEVEVLSTIIIALESGGAVYGNGDWGCFGEAYATTSIEHAITIGAGQWYGVEALKLLKKIYETDPVTFKKLDTAGIYSDLSDDWTCYRVSKTSAKAKAIVSIISSEVGKKCQKLLLGEQMQEYAEAAKNLGVTETDALAECCNFHHQGGYGAMKRVINKTPKPYTLENLYKAVLTDNVPNQVGTYTSRQRNFYNMMKAHWPYGGTSKNDTTTDNKKQEEVVTVVNTTGGLTKSVSFTGYATTNIIPRTWAGDNKSPMTSVKVINKGTSIGVCTSIADDKGNEWYYVLINSKFYGFVPAKYISKTKPANNTPTIDSTLSKTVKWNGKVTADSLYVRKWAGTENVPLISCPTVSYGTTVGVCSTIKAKDGSNWYYIKTPKGTYGFSSAKYIEKI